ncbi:MAG: response regulator transcription factor [Candidatus Thiodiazotropha sp.]
MAQTTDYQVLLVEDEPATRQRLAEAVARHPQLSIVAAVGNVAEARTVLARTRPDVLLTDIGLPDGDGTEIIAELGRLGYETEAMVITVFGDERHVIRAVEAGATGYLLKDDRPEAITDAIMELLAGGSPMSASIARYLLRRLQPPKTEALESAQAELQLSQREQEVLRQIAKGFSYAEISDLLNVSTHTVASHLKSIYRKIGVHSRGEAVFEATQLGLI